MSEPMFPAPEAEVAPAAAVIDEPTRSNRTPLLIIGGVLGAVVVGGGAFLLLSGGGDTALPAASPSRSAAPAPAASASPKASPSAKPVTVPATTTVTTRDPFKPLFVAAVATSGSSSATAATPAPSAAPATPVTPVTPVTPTTPTVQVTLTVSKIDAAAQTAVVSVDGKAYPASVGKVFAKNYMVYSVFNAQCVGVLYGDQSVPVCTTAPATITP